MGSPKIRMKKLFPGMGAKESSLNPENEDSLFTILADTTLILQYVNPTEV
jgi:hypothetical protein